jgi:hypothetical protein
MNSSPRRDPVSLDIELSRNLVELLAAKQPHHDVHILLGRPPRLVAEVLLAWSSTV